MNTTLDNVTVISTDHQRAITAHLDRVVDDLRPVSVCYIKPNMTTPTPKEGATTCAWLVGLVADALLRRGLRVCLVESSTRGRPLRDCYQNYGFYRRLNRVEAFIDANESETFSVEDAAGNQLMIPRFLRDPRGLLINLPCVKQCSVYRVCGAMKNLLGLLGNPEKQIFHPTLGEALRLIHDNVACRKTCIADGTFFWLGDFDSGRAVRKDVCLAGEDYAAVDGVMERLLAEEARVSRA